MMNKQPEHDSAASKPAEIPPQQLQMALENLRAEQNLPGGVLAGLAAALLGAGVWALITALTEYQIGWMAIGVGFLVGFAVRIVGKGIDPLFGVIGAVLSLLGCVLGNLLTVTYFIAANEGVPFLDALAQLDLEVAVNILVSTFNYMDIIFYAIAVYFGYRYAFRRVTEQDLNRSLGKPV